MIRLYPNTSNPEVLERLAGVPQGTSVKADQLSAELSALNGSDDEYDLWEAANARAGDAARKLCEFRLFGFGRFRNPTLVEAAGHDPNVGSSNCEALTAALLHAQGVTLPDTVPLASLDGLSWS